MSEDINFGAITEALNDKADRDLNNTNPVADYVVERYYDEQGNWYEVWKSGRLRQGGIKEGSGSVTFLKPFINANYTITTSMMAAEAHYYSVGVHINPTPSTTGFTASMWNNQAAGSDFGSWYWQAEGKGA
jgi:hypothetical protein